MFPGLDEAELLLPGWQRSSEAFLADRSVGSQVEWRDKERQDGTGGVLDQELQTWSNVLG